MAKDKEKKDFECPNCKDTGKFDDGEQKITCPCQALKE